MAEGIKLYHDFKKLITEAGEVKLAWFTSFNFNVSFFEKYVLSALVKINSQDLRNLKDFEALNDRIVNAENGSVDVRVFHDYRAMSPDIKRTSIQTFAINPAELDKQFSHGVFHPKVALIVNDHDEAWLMTGSANLSISAWSNNSEGVVIRKILDKRNAQRIVTFFSRLVSPKVDQKILRQLNKKWQRNFQNEDTNWEFFDSFSNQSILTKLALERSARLHVWSPYFSEDLFEIIQSHLSEVNQICIVPDKTNSNKIRISEEVFSSLKGIDRVRFMRDLHEYSSEDILVHAKIWLTNSKLAVGSWNFSSGGLNLSKTANNLEAGVVIDVTEKEYIEFLDSCNLMEIDSLIATSSETLEEDRKHLLTDWKLTCQIYADWSNYTYRLETEEVLDNKNYYIDLPGKRNRIALIDFNNYGSSFYEEHKSLLKDRLFIIYDAPRDGNKVFMGVIIEINPRERPAVGFDSMNDLLRAWADKRPEHSTQYQELNYEEDMESGEELSDQISKALKGDYSNAWFTMFLAFEQMKSRINEVKERWRDLKMIGYNIPGSVSQLSGHLERLKVKVEAIRLNEYTEGDQIDINESFVWFMINEGNSVIHDFNKIKGNKDAPDIKSIENFKLSFTGVNKKQMNEWMTYIKNTCSYTNA